MRYEEHPACEDALTFPKWARTPPSASWRFDTGREGGRDRPSEPRSDTRRRDRTPPRRSARSPSPRRRDYSPRKDDRRRDDRDRDYDDRRRSRSPGDRDREMKDDRRDDDRENGTNGEDRKGMPLDPGTTWEDCVALR